MSESWRSAASTEIIRLRARMLQDIRAFFDQRDVLEVETPLLSAAATTDPHLASFSTRYREQELYLNTSPEYCMKRLLADHGDAIYQVCKSFRSDELGRWHNPEFSMLEWYRPGFDMFQLMAELLELVQLLATNNGIIIKSINSISYADAFFGAAGIDPHSASADDCRHCASEYGIEQPVGLEDDVDEWLDWLLTQLVIPSFDEDAFTLLYDYPRTQAALARLYEDTVGRIVAARFELFFGATELANGFDELRDADEQRLRFEHENLRRQSQGMPVAILDDHLIMALQHGLPACSGVALGLDRLLMVLAGEDLIEHVLAFPFARI